MAQWCHYVNTSVLRATYFTPASTWYTSPSIERKYILLAAPEAGVERVGVLRAGLYGRWFPEF
jgi:hypothetical protein